jgi:hypothetical protein
VAAAARAGAKLARGALKAGGLLRAANDLLGLISVDNLAERANIVDGRGFYGGARSGRRGGSSSAGVVAGSGGGGGDGNNNGAANGSGRRRRRRPPPIPGESDSDAAAV